VDTTLEEDALAQLSFINACSTGTNPNLTRRLLSVEIILPFFLSVVVEVVNVEARDPKMFGGVVVVIGNTTSFGINVEDDSAGGGMIESLSKKEEDRTIDE
jgi:hypothetical protein